MFKLCCCGKKSTRITSLTADNSSHNCLNHDNNQQQNGDQKLQAPIERKQLDLTPLKESGVPVYFVCGGPGSGKGTQCKVLSEHYGLSHLSSGDLLRAEVSSGTERGAELSKIMESGELVPLEVVLDLLAEAMLSAVVEKGTKGFLIDGYPRELKQGTQFEEEVVECKHCVYFKVAEETLVERLLERGKTSGRVDDNMETIKKRLETFNNETQPVLEYYTEKDKVTEIDASGTIEEVSEAAKAFFDGQFDSKADE